MNICKNKKFLKLAVRSRKGAVGMELAVISILVILTIVAILALFDALQNKEALKKTPDQASSGNTINPIFPQSTTLP